MPPAGKSFHSLATTKDMTMQLALCRFLRFELWDELLAPDCHRRNLAMPALNDANGVVNWKEFV